MATKKKTKVDENVVAAKQAAEDALIKASRALDVMGHRIEDQEERIADLEAALEASENLREQRIADLQAEHRAAIDPLKAKLATAETKLSKVQATLA